MAIKSYNDIYVSEVAETLGIMFEHIVNLGFDPVIFWNNFTNSNVAFQIEHGNPKYLSCSSLDYLDEILNGEKISHSQDIHKNRFFWAGWILAYYQQRTGYTFFKINCLLPIEKVLDLYNPLHEADITKFFDIADEYLKSKSITNLKKARQECGLSQSMLAKEADVELRSIQMYEQRRNDINKAQVQTIYKLAKALGRDIEDLLED